MLQEFYFKVEVSKLRPWVTYRPVFDTRPIVALGTDNIYTHDCLDPYRGYGWVTLSDWYCEDIERIFKRLNLVTKEMGDWSLPKVVREYLQELEGKCFIDDEADKLFDGYCNKIREANELPLK